MSHPPPYTLVLSDKKKPACSSPKRTLTIKIKRPNTQQTTIRISIALRTSSNGHLDDGTISDMEYMLQYHEINFDSVIEIIDETTNYVAGVILTLEDVTVTDLDVIVKITDFNPQAWSRIGLDVYTIDLRNNIRDSIPSEENDICAICHNELGASGDLNTLPRNKKKQSSVFKSSNSNGSKKAVKELTQPQQHSQQSEVNTAQPASSISTQESSTSGVTNVYKLTTAERKRYQLVRIEDRPEDIDPDYLHYMRAIGAFDSVQPQPARGKSRGRKGRR
uniref:Uncharacterized protein n=1 Tax=Brassica campestris TaxID=3711 RepID=M4F2H5_BRACM